MSHLPSGNKKPASKPAAQPVAKPRTTNDRNIRKGTVYNKEGTIVGASAPEIGAGNKGRAMLERMGWSAGMR
jgi:hypothetical protein